MLNVTIVVFIHIIKNYDIKNKKINKIISKITI